MVIESKARQGSEKTEGARLWEDILRKILPCAVGRTGRLGNDEACQKFSSFVLTMIERVKTDKGDRALATNLQIRMRLMKWVNNLFERIEEVKISNLRQVGLFCLEKFITHSRTGKMGWAQFEIGHSDTAHSNGSHS